jgi:hypothetical protein
MKRLEGKTRFAGAALFCAAIFLPALPALAQIGPTEISNPVLRNAEDKYYSQLEALHKAISHKDFPYPFLLSRYVTSNPDSAHFDSRGLEFVNFQGQMVLKVSGIYRAAFNADQLTQNERAARTFREVVVPVLGLMAQVVPPDVECDSVGFEIAYHARAPTRSFEYEGKEILVVVLSREDAFSLADHPDEKQLQMVLNRSTVYVNGEEFGLALGARNPLDLESLERSSAPQPAGGSYSSSSHLSGAGPRSTSPPLHAQPGGHSSSTAPAAPTSTHPPPAPAVRPGPAPTQADADHLQSIYQPQFDALMEESAGQFHLVDYAPPSFTLFHDRLVLQLTFRNPQPFDKSAGSIYKRAAQSFDLFLAPQLKSVVRKLPALAEIDALDFSVLNRLGAEKDSSEAVEFICPVSAVRSFINDEITGQDLINQSIVLVNGVRISLTLQLVE